MQPPMAWPPSAAGAVASSLRTADLWDKQSNETRPLTRGVGRAPRGIRTPNRQIRSRFSTVRWMTPGVVLAGRVGGLVRLVASCLSGCPWRNDRENDHPPASEWLRA